MRKTGLVWLWVSAVVIVIDRITKIIAKKYLVAYLPTTVLPFLNVTLAYNKGAAFSFLGNANGWQMWMFGLIAVVVCVALIFWLAKISFKQRWLGVAVALVIGGALGNLWDRISYGQVIDFIQVHYANWYFPVFNIADSAVCVGAFMLLIDALFFNRKQR